MTGSMVDWVRLGVGVGVAATVTMDVLGAVARRFGLAAGAKGIWVGRWYLGIARGRFVHSDIASAPKLAGEQRAALIGHYMIGIVLAVFYVVGAGSLGVSPGSFPAALGYGLATCIFPWLVVLPALGFGAFGRKGPQELRLFTATVLNHSFYGLGLWWSVKVLELAP
ncbi:MAG: DUF2938 family protein [Holophagae bacterium]